MAKGRNPMIPVLVVAVVSYFLFLCLFLYLAFDMLRVRHTGLDLWLRLGSITAVFILATLSEFVLKMKMGYKKSLPYRIGVVVLFLLVLFWVMDYQLITAIISTVLIVTLYYFWDKAKARRVEG